jgi:nicotinamide-nucleotide amidase
MEEQIRIATLVVGDELLNGEISDTNTAVMGRALGKLGCRAVEGRTVADHEESISAALRELSFRYQVVLVAGGLGPTRDDLTARAASRAFERRLVLNDEALESIRTFFQEQRLEMDPRNEKQALLPQKAVPLANPAGTAPGFVLTQNSCRLLFFPGVPAELEAMLECHLPPLFDEWFGDRPPMGERVLKVFGLSEPKTESMIESQPLPEGVTIAFGVDHPFVHLKLRAAGDDWEERLDQAEVSVRKKLGDFIVARERETLAQNVAALMKQSGLTLALAESCTGGMAAEWLTAIPGASSFLDRAAVTYSNQAKNDWLGVSKRILHEYGAVSEFCARAMATGLRQSTRTDITLAITGIAGPDGGTEDKPVGTVFIALSAGDAEQAKRYTFGGTRDQVRRASACMALEWLRRYLIEHQRR